MLRCAYAKSHSCNRKALFIDCSKIAKAKTDAAVINELADQTGKSLSQRPLTAVADASPRPQATGLSLRS